MDGTYETLADIRGRHPGRWVLLDDLKLDHGGAVIGGVLLRVAGSLEELLPVSDSLVTSGHTAVEFTGPVGDICLVGLAVETGGH